MDGGGGDGGGEVGGCGSADGDGSEGEGTVLVEMRNSLYWESRTCSRRLAREMTSQSLRIDGLLP